MPSKANRRQSKATPTKDGGWNVSRKLPKCVICSLTRDEKDVEPAVFSERDLKNMGPSLCVHHAATWDANPIVEELYLDRTNLNSTCAECERRFYSLDEYLCKYCSNEAP